MASIDNYDWDASITEDERKAFLASLSSTPTYPLKEERKSSTEQHRASEGYSQGLLGELTTLGFLK